MAAGAGPVRAVPRGATAAGLVALTAASLGLGAYHLGSRSLWLNEGYTWLAAAQKAGSIYSVAQKQGGHLLGYYMVVHLVIVAFGDGAVAMRAPSVVLGAAAVPMLFGLGRRLGGPLAGWASAVLLAVSEPMVFWQQNARDYSLVVLLAVGTAWCLVAAIQSGRVAPLTGWAALTALSCYTHPELAFVLPAQLLVFGIWCRSVRLRLIMVALVVGGLAASIPPLQSALHSPSYASTFLAPPDRAAAVEIATFLAGAAGSAAPVTTADHLLLVVVGAIVVVAAGQLLASLRRHRADPDDLGGAGPDGLGLALALSWLVVPPVVDWLVSEAGHPSFVDRYLIVSLPAGALTVGLALSRLRPRSVGILGLAWLTVFRAGVLAPTYSVPVDDYRAATTQVLAGARAGDCITFSGISTVGLYDYYLGHVPAHAGEQVPTQRLPDWVDTDRPAVVEREDVVTPATLAAIQSPVYVRIAAALCARVWLYSSDTGSLTGPSVGEREDAESYLLVRRNLAVWFQPVRSYRFRGVDVELYRRARVPGPP